VRPPEAAVPSLAHEQVLIIYDPKTEKEHFIREVAFNDGSEAFGFVVPTPSLPEVKSVAKSPFPALSANVPSDDFGSDANGDNMEGGGGVRPGPAKPAVTVYDVSKIGSFTAFVLAATDAKAFGKWLEKNGFVTTPDTDEWLRHYVRMKFFYVAMRYDPPKAGDDSKRESVLAETVRISFSTPLPYYPYLEPRHVKRSQPERLLDLWLLSTARWVPIAARKGGAQTSWVRPLRPTDGRASRTLLERILSPELVALLPPGDLIVDTFQDQKSSREGLGDVLFAQATHATLGKEQVERLKPLLGILDPELVPDEEAAP
jgi:Uncharacterized protein conserved in bacteria (DUF2330)